jgi:P-type E1-E2 ATPase
MEEVPNTDILVGDVLLVKYGDIIPADGIIIESMDLATDESSLTGESDRIAKNNESDIRVLSGTDVVEGKGIHSRIS